MPFFTRCGAPASPFGGLRVVMRTELIVPSAAAATASSPSSPPVGTMMRPPCCLASSSNSGRGSSAPQESTITCLPAVSIGRQICSRIAAGAHSTARSACSGNSSSATIGTSMPSSSSQPRAFSSSRAATQASVSPGTPSASLRASARPMVPSPAIAMRMSHGSPLVTCMAVIRCDHGSGNDRLTRPGQPDKAMGKRLHTEDIDAQEFSSPRSRPCSHCAARRPRRTIPTRPVTMVIPFAAGGPTDVLGRVVAARMSEILGQQVVVENVGGAGGMTGAQARRDRGSRTATRCCSAPSARRRRARRCTRSRSTIR